MGLVLEHNPRHEACPARYLSVRLAACFPEPGLTVPRFHVHVTMALSSRAHAFSVESLVGKSLKRKLEDHEDATSRAHPMGRLTPPDPVQDTGGNESGEEAKGQRARARSCLSPPPCPGISSVCLAVQVELQGAELWKRFHEIGTEMIITKAGRRMFPAVRVKIKGLDLMKQYYIAMDIVPVDSKRYRYVYHSSQWMVAGNTEQSSLSPRLYVHPDSPASGETWMKQIVSFDRVKLTNNDMDDKGHIILQSMHKYKPRLHVILKQADANLSVNQLLPTDGVQTFSFPETEFTTVTAYQNQQITRLKIDRNPFAKGFRDPGRNRVSLEGVIDSYPWRAAVPTLDFQAFNIQTRGRCSDSSQVTYTETPCSLTSVISPSCSPPLFHVTSNTLGMTCRDAHLCNVDFPICYTSGRNMGPQRFTYPPSYDRVRVNTSPSEIFATQRSPSLMFRLPYFSSINALTTNHGKAGDLNGHGVQVPNAAFSHLQIMQPRSTISQDNPMHQDLYNFSVRRPYSLYGYNLAASSRLATHPFKLITQNSPPPNANTPVTERTLGVGKAQWQPAANPSL
ncbi:T-box transcription factor TBX22-like [Callorhinchus milii]|uniref:T-box transcription factor TBX22-like n=1 Tax=Callorhinchus milii TaxID=7868 RepID=UPI001C3FB80F|nr:T-box transcription factor TBX22-like [Callorhinchus milii]